MGSGRPQDTLCLSPGQDASTSEQEAQIDAPAARVEGAPDAGSGAAMDSEFPQREAPPAGSVLYSPPALQSPLQVSLGPRAGSGGGGPRLCASRPQATRRLLLRPRLALGDPPSCHLHPSGTWGAGTPVTDRGCLFFFGVFCLII